MERLVTSGTKFKWLIFAGTKCLFKPRKKDILSGHNGIQNISNYDFNTFLENLEKELKNQLDVTLYQ